MIKKIILQKFNLIPDTMIILGSGLNNFTDKLSNSLVISYSEIFDITTDKTIGHSGNLFLGYINKKPLIVMSGRKHYYENPTNAEMRKLIQSFAEIGVKNIIVTNACGGMNESFKPGDIMVIEDHINMMGRNPLIGYNSTKLGPKFVDMTEPYDLEFRKIIDEEAIKQNLYLQHGVYVSYLGPNYETKAEIRAFKILGGDAVGMSTVPEVIIARQANMRVLGLSLITNMSTGISANKLSHEEVIKISNNTAAKFSNLIIGFLDRI